MVRRDVKKAAPDVEGPDLGAGRPVLGVSAAAPLALTPRYRRPRLPGLARDRRDAHGGLDESDADPLDDRVIAAWERLGRGMVAGLRAEAA